MQVQLSPSYQPLDSYFQTNPFFEALHQRDERGILALSADDSSKEHVGQLELIGMVHLFAEAITNRTFSSRCAYHAALILRKMLCRSFAQDSRMHYDNPFGSHVLINQLEHGLKLIAQSSPLYFEIIVMKRMIHAATLNRDLTLCLKDIYPSTHFEEISNFEQLEALLDLASKFLKDKFECAATLEQLIEPKNEIKDEPIIDARTSTLKRSESPVADERPSKKACREDDTTARPETLGPQAVVRVAEKLPLEDAIHRVKKSIFSKKKRENDQA